MASRSGNKIELNSRLGLNDFEEISNWIILPDIAIVMRFDILEEII